MAIINIRDGKLNQETDQWVKYPTKGKNETVFYEGFNENVLTVAQQVADICHGRHTWQGVRQWKAPSGLAKHCNAYLKKAGVAGKVTEECLNSYNQAGECMSIYSPAW